MPLDCLLSALRRSKPRIVQCVDFGSQPIVGELLHTARFHTTVAQPSQLPREGLPEVAFVGRSNAGKSSAINRLCARRRLAFASRTPGRTQALNYFAVGPVKLPPQAFLVDMPGYGFATAPGEVKQRWNRLAGEYLAQRPCLAGVVLVIDIRRLVGPLDAELIRWISPEVPVLALLTKSDKLGAAQQRKALDEARDQIAVLRAPNPITLLAFSATSGRGIEATAQQIGEWLAIDAEPDTKQASHQFTPPSGDSSHDR